MPVYWPTVNIYYQTFTGTGLNINSSYSSKAYKQYDGLLGGEDWWYYTNSVTIPFASPPTGYSHKWKFVAWSKNGGSLQYTTVERWRKAWGDLGYGYRLPINEIINRDTGVELPAYNGEVFNYYFHIEQTSGIGYSYTYVYNNGDANSIIEVRYGDTITLSIGTKSKTGHYFDYFTSSTFGNKTNGSSFVYNTTGFATFSAVWTVNTYTATLKYDNGAANTTATYNYNSAFTLASTGFTKTGYTFSGWATNPNIGTGTSFTWTNAGDITFTGQWTANPYTATLIYGNGAANTTATYNYNSAFTLASTGFTRTGYTFSGWTSNPDIGTGTSFTWTNVGNIIFTGQWTANTYTIRYNTNGGNGGSTDNTTAVYNNSLTIRNNGFTRTGYSFIGWSTTAGYTNSVSATYIQNTNIAHPTSADTLDLYAVWALLYTITFNNSGRGEVINTVLTGIANSVISNFPALNNLIGFNFGGWMNNNVAVSSITLTTADVILYAKWVAGGSLSLSSIQFSFGGNIDINLSEYYLNSCYIFSPDGIGIPSSNQISFSQFIDKSKTKSYINTPWNINMPANMDATGGTRIPLSTKVNDSASIGGGGTPSAGDNYGSPIGFPFYWYGRNCGTSGNYYTYNNYIYNVYYIYWNTNNVMTFGSPSSYYYSDPQIQKTIRGVHMGYANRKGGGIDSTSVSHVQFPVITIGDRKIKRFWVKQYNSNADTPQSTNGEPAIEMEIFLITDSKYQYILIRMAKWNATNTGIWDISDGTSFKNVFYDFPVKAGDSVLLIGSLTGYDWVSYNLPYKDAITNMSSNLVLRLNGYNIDGKNNSTLTSGTSTITSWYNSTITSFTTTQNTTSYKPGYTENSVVFSTNNYFLSTITLQEYQKMNIFVVFKIPVKPSNTCFLWTCINALNSRSRSLSFNTSDNIIIIDGFSNALSINYLFNTNTIYVVNCEYIYDTRRTGSFWINNNLKGTWNLTVPFGLEPDGPFQTIFGASNNSGLSSFIGIIYEIIIIDRILKDFERRNIYNHLNTRWNINIPDIRIILRLDGQNIDGTYNSTLTSGTSTISSWFNSGSVASLTTTQTDEVSKPTYNSNSVAFTNDKGLFSTMEITSYPMLNIFVVWKHKVFPTGSDIHTLWADISLFRAIRIHSNNIIRVYIGHPNETNPSETMYGILNNPFSINTMLIYNVEYNSPGFPGKFFINNTNYMDFTSRYTNNSGKLLSTAFGSSLKLTEGYNSIKGDIFEIIVINRLLTDIERTNIYTLLKAKWNVS